MSLEIKKYIHNKNEWAIVDLNTYFYLNESLHCKTIYSDLYQKKN